MKMSTGERQILQTLDECINRPPARIVIDSIVERVELQLSKQSTALLAWEPIPLEIYGNGIPSFIKSSWVFVLRANTSSGAERHPNSHQRVMSYRGKGDLQVFEEEQWISNLLVSDDADPLEERWLSIPIDVWHQAVVPGENWVVVSFHTVSAEELIEERPDHGDSNVFHQRRYMDETN